MLQFEEFNPKKIAIDNQMEQIMQLKQDESTIDQGFIKIVIKEIKVYKKYQGCNFLWGQEKYELLNELVATATAEHFAATKTSQSVEQINYSKNLSKR